MLSHNRALMVGLPPLFDFLITCTYSPWLQLLITKHHINISPNSESTAYNTFLSSLIVSDTEFETHLKKMFQLFTCTAFKIVP